MPIVSTYEVRRAGVVQCVGSVKTCAEFAWLTARKQHPDVLEQQLDAFERALRRSRAATLCGEAWTISPLEEEYEEDEEEEASVG